MTSEKELNLIKSNNNQELVLNDINEISSPKNTPQIRSIIETSPEINSKIIRARMLSPQNSKDKIDSMLEKMDKKQSNILRKSIQNIKNNEIIEYTFHIVKEDINEIWPKDMILLCIPDDNDIYFKHVKLFNNELVKNYKKNNKEYFDVTITILFKQNIQYIKKGKYHLKAQLISDSLEIITLDAGKLELEIVD